MNDVEALKKEYQHQQIKRAYTHKDWYQVAPIIKQGVWSTYIQKAPVYSEVAMNCVRDCR